MTRRRVPSARPALLKNSVNRLINKRDEPWPRKGLPACYLLLPCSHFCPKSVRAFHSGREGQAVGT